MKHEDIIKSATKVAEELRGTANSLQGALQAMDLEGLDDDLVFCGKLDALVFECTECGWWCLQEEMAEHPDDEWVCTDCYTDGDQS